MQTVLRFRQSRKKGVGAVLEALTEGGKPPKVIWKKRRNFGAEVKVINELRGGRSKLDTKREGCTGEEKEEFTYGANTSRTFSKNVEGRNVVL